MNPIVWLSAAAQQVHEAAISWRYGAEAVFFLGVAYGLMRWIGRTLREISGAETPERKSSLLARALGIVHESQAAAPQAAAPPAAGQPVAEIAPGSAPSPLPNSGRASAAQVLVHCPACGMALTHAPHPLPFAVTCEGCARHVQVRGDGPGRLSVVIGKQ